MSVKLLLSALVFVLTSTTLALRNDIGELCKKPATEYTKAELKEPHEEDEASRKSFIAIVRTGIKRLVKQVLRRSNWFEPLPKQKSKTLEDSAINMELATVLRLRVKQNALYRVGDQPDFLLDFFKKYQAFQRSTRRTKAMRTSATSVSPPDGGEVGSSQPQWIGATAEAMNAFAVEITSMKKKLATGTVDRNMRLLLSAIDDLDCAFGAAVDDLRTGRAPAPKRALKELVALGDQIQVRFQVPDQVVKLHVQLKSLPEQEVSSVQEVVKLHAQLKSLPEQEVSSVQEVKPSEELEISNEELDEKLDKAQGALAEYAPDPSMTPSDKPFLSKADLKQWLSKAAWFAAACVITTAAVITIPSMSMFAVPLFVATSAGAMLLTGDGELVADLLIAAT